MTSYSKEIYEERKSSGKKDKANILEEIESLQLDDQEEWYDEDELPPTARYVSVMFDKMLKIISEKEYETEKKKLTKSIKTRGIPKASSDNFF